MHIFMAIIALMPQLLKMPRILLHMAGKTGCGHMCTFKWEDTFVVLGNPKSCECEVVYIVAFGAVGISILADKGTFMKILMACCTIVESDGI